MPQMKDIRKKKAGKTVRSPGMVVRREHGERELKQALLNELNGRKATAQGHLRVAFQALRDAQEAQEHLRVALRALRNAQESYAGIRIPRSTSAGRNLGTTMHQVDDALEAVRRAKRGPFTEEALSSIQRAEKFADFTDQDIE